MIINFYGRTIRVRAHCGAELEAQDSRGLWYGAPRNEIAIDPRISAFDQLDTLAHELSHAIYEVLKLGNRTTEERVCNQFGTAWAELFRSNPGLVSAIVGASFYNLPIVKGD